MKRHEHKKMTLQNAKDCLAEVKNSAECFDCVQRYSDNYDRLRSYGYGDADAKVIIAALRLVGVNFIFD